MHHMHDDRSLTDGGRNPFDVAGPSIADNKNTWKACLQHVRAAATAAMRPEL